MDNIKLLPPMERPREKLRFMGAQALCDAEVLAILFGSGMPDLPLNQLCDSLLSGHKLQEIAAMDIDALCRFKGIGPAKATILLAATEYSRRLQPAGLILKNNGALCAYLRPALEKETQLQYLLLLLSDQREPLATCEAGSVLPDIQWVTAMALKAGAKRFLLGRNGWPAFSNAESRYRHEVAAAAAMLGLVFEGLMAVGPERFKMI